VVKILKIDKYSHLLSSKSIAVGFSQRIMNFKGKSALRTKFPKSYCISWQRNVTRFWSMGL